MSKVTDAIYRTPSSTALVPRQAFQLVIKAARKFPPPVIIRGAAAVAYIATPTVAARLPIPSAPRPSVSAPVKPGRRSSSIVASFATI